MIYDVSSSVYLWYMRDLKHYNKIISKNHPKFIHAEPSFDG